MATTSRARERRERKGDRSPLAILLDPKTDIPLGERDIRVEDYLNDKIQTATDFENLDRLIASVEAQKLQLEDQLADARQKFSTAKDTATNRTSLMQQQTQEFEKQQASVQERLMIVTSSDTPEEATERLRGPLEKLRKLRLAEQYVDMLEYIESLKDSARECLPENPKEALKPYIQLKELAIQLQQLQEPAEGAAIHLTTYVQKTSTDLWVEMKEIMSDEFESVLKKSKWPNPAAELTQEWSDSFGKLLDLQAPEILAAREPLVLLPMSVLAKPFILQFRYHFFSDKPTNHPHQLGDYFFQWFLGTIAKWEDFLRENVGPVLAAHFRGNILAGNTLYVDPVAALITALLPVLKEKVDTLVSEISREPQYLSRFMVQLMNFDDAIRARFNYDGGNPEHGWKGLTWDVLDTWFERWLEVEKEFALQRYRDIMDAPDSGLIDYDSYAAGKTKPTYGATKVTDLILTVTLQYNKLRRFSHKFRFLVSIQAEILDQYLGRLRDSLDVYQTVTSTVGRTLHGVTKEQLAALEGVGGLESLCKVFGSAEHLNNMLNEWGNEEFFVDLWDHLQDRAKVTPVEDNLVGNMTYTEVKDCTSEAVGSRDEGSVFDVAINDFQSLRNKAEKLITGALKYKFPANLSQYLSKPEWQTIDDAPLSSLSLITVTPELDQPLQIFQRNLNFLHKTLGNAPFKRICRESLESLEHLLYNDVLLRQDFSTLGAARFMQDVTAIQDVVDSCMPRGSGPPLGMPRLKEAAALLNLPVEAEEGRMPLMEACQEIYAGGAQAKLALETLGMTHLTNFDARSILAKRLETQQY
ncbi:RINT-1 family protein-like protein [Hyaloscypha finlandica]|nr:RINT-1 family protein-like protein [Hyaloscypha finlandica]